GTIRNGTRNGVTLNTINADFRGAFIAGSLTGTSQTVTFTSPKLLQEGIGKGWRLNPLSGTQLYADEAVWDTAYDTGNIVSNIQVGTYVQTHASLGANTRDTSVVTTQSILSGD